LVFGMLDVVLNVFDVSPAPSLPPAVRGTSIGGLVLSILIRFWTIQLSHRFKHPVELFHERGRRDEGLHSSSTELMLQSDYP
jgi:hypothetical protein